MKELLLHNVKILCSDGSISPHNALFLKDGAIQAIGHFRDLKLNLQNSKKTINLQGKLLLPTFCDVHTHFFEMAKMSQYIDLSKATSVEE
ncbi:MAG: hypothetical protein RBS92_08320, partial [Candidatus Cloacimonadales bacterium]|nr:hypothetical protein [Candidatus Cloacimonadales bacterium]